MPETSAPRDGQRVVVLTGAASGIGFATAELFRDLGDLVFGLDIAGTVPEGVTYVECNVADKSLSTV
jgi:NAD(P)-dependent dehydrogenase (short-subunit alcohol dehydrogenase family)